MRRREENRDTEVLKGYGFSMNVFLLHTHCLYEIGILFFVLGYLFGIVFSAAGYWNPEGVLVQWCEKGTEVQLLEITSDVSEE